MQLLQKVQETNISDVSCGYKFRCRYNYDLLLHMISDDAENTGVAVENTGMYCADKIFVHIVVQTSGVYTNWRRYVLY